MRVRRNRQVSTAKGSTTSISTWPEGRVGSPKTTNTPASIANPAIPMISSQSMDSG